MTQKSDFQSYFHEDQNKIFQGTGGAAAAFDSDEEQMSDGVDGEQIAQSEPTLAKKTTESGKSALDKYVLLHCAKLHLSILDAGQDQNLKQILRLNIQNQMYFNDLNMM